MERCSDPDVNSQEVRFFTATLLVCVTLVAQASDLLVGEPLEGGTFELLREPSGVTALDDSTLIVVEDESRHALRRLERVSGNSHFEFTEYEQASGTGFIQRRLLGPLDDLEGIARLSAERFFVIGSHENASRGKMPAREKLVLFTREGNDLVSALMRQDLYDHVDRKYPQLSKKTNSKKKRKLNSLNIEGLAYDRKRQQLLIGLRTPTIKNNAIIIKILNALQYMQGEEPLFADQLQLIDLDKGSIRALAYDDRSDALLIASQRESGGKDRSSLWVLPLADSVNPVRIPSEDNDLFDDVEGLTPVADKILFVRDAGGGKSNRNQLWFTLSRSQLGLSH